MQCNIHARTGGQNSGQKQKPRPHGAPFYIGTKIVLGWESCSDTVAALVFFFFFSFSFPLWLPHREKVFLDHHLSLVSGSGGGGTSLLAGGNDGGCVDTQFDWLSIQVGNWDRDLARSRGRKVGVATALAQSHVATGLSHCHFSHTILSQEKTLESRRFFFTSSALGCNASFLQYPPSPPPSPP